MLFFFYELKIRVKKLIKEPDKTAEINNEESSSVDFSKEFIEKEDNFLLSNDRSTLSEKIISLNDADSLQLKLDNGIVIFTTPDELIHALQDTKHFRANLKDNII